MAARDVILAALLDWRLSDEAPLYLRAALGPHDLARIAEVAARAVEGQTAPPPVGTADEAQACARRSGVE